MRKLFTAALATAALGCCAAANAALIDNVGSGFVTDTNTGLQWLSLNATQGVSYNSVLNGYNGYTTSGWTVASAQQIGQLALSYIGTPDKVQCLAACGTAFANDVNQYYNPTKVASDLAVMAALGITQIGFNNGALTVSSRGYDLGQTGGSPGSAQFNLSVSLFNPSQDYGSFDTFSNAATGDQPDYGTYLVKDPASVPAPETWALFGVGLVGVAFSRRRTRALVAR